MSFTPTNEQAAIVAQQALGKNMKVEAVAGSGKTSTVKLMVESTDKRALYLAFNKAAADEAAQKMGESYHVTCKTTHSIAFAAVGVKYKEKLQRPKYDPKNYVNVGGSVKEITLLLKLKDLDGANKRAQARLVKQTLATFESSADTLPSSDHVPYGEILNLESKARILGRGFSKTMVIKNVVAAANRLWELRINVNNRVLITHDTYMKLFQLSKPQLPYEIIYLDEAQDTSDCVIDIVSIQDAQVICVGDSYQAIYGWRGAVNALAKVEAPSLPLSQSFRFGPRVARVANQVLNTGNFVKGWEELDTIVGEVDTTKPYTHLFRTNMAIIRQGVRLLEQGIAVEIVADIKGFMSKLNAMDDLLNGRKHSHEDIVIFDTWEDLIEEAEATGGELKLLARLITSDRYPEVKAALRSYKKPIKPRVVLTTAHKSKGMEYSQVILADDFPNVLDEEGNYTELNEMERNLLYVAATRATKVLQVNPTLADIITYRECNGFTDTDPDHEEAFEADNGVRDLEKTFNDFVGNEVKELVA